MTAAGGDALSHALEPAWLTAVADAAPALSSWPRNQNGEHCTPID
jgi:hypothetical protein